MTESVADRFRRLAAAFTTSVDAAQDSMDAATPCEGWDVAAVVDHVVSTEHEFCARFGFAPELSGADPAVRWPQMRDALQAALDDPDRAHTPFDGFFGPSTFAEAIETFYCLDLAVHAWDIARAIGRADLATIEPGDMARCRELLAPAGDVVRSPGIFGPEVAVGPDASEQDRFLAWTGRRP